jgi:hypothetical protein
MQALAEKKRDLKQGSNHDGKKLKERKQQRKRKSRKTKT